MSSLLDFLLNIQTANAQVGAVAGETETQLAGILDFIIIKIPSFIAAFIVFVLFFFIAKAIKGIVENRMAARFEEHKEVQILAGRTASASTLIIGATIALNVAGIDLTVIIAAAGFGIGFALKDIIINFLAGIMILAQKQFTIGDFINIDGTIGKIKEIQGRATILQALDGTKVVVPNSELFTKQVISYTSNPFRRIEVAVGVKYSTDLIQAVKTCYEALKTTKGVLVEPKPVVLVTDFGESSINLVVRAWVESRGGWLNIKSDLAVSIKKEFDKVGINIPFPIRTIVFDKDTKAGQEEQMQKMMQEQPQKELTEEEQKPEWVEKSQLAKEAIQSTPEQPAPQAPEVKPPVETKPSKDQPGAAFLLHSEGKEGEKENPA